MRARTTTVGGRRSLADPRRRPAGHLVRIRSESRATSRSKTRRGIATASARRCRSGLPESLLEPVRDPLGDLVRRYARTHAPFAAADFAARYGLSASGRRSGPDATDRRRPLDRRRVPARGHEREWTDPGVLRMLRRRSLAKLRHEIEPVDQAVLGRLTTTWQGIVKRRRGADALLDAIEQLQGAPLPASLLETEILPARLDGYDPADLDAVTAAGEVVWVGVEPLGDRDGRIALVSRRSAAAVVAARDRRPTCRRSNRLRRSGAGPPKPCAEVKDRPHMRRACQVLRTQRPPANLTASPR